MKRIKPVISIVISISITVVLFLYLFNWKNLVEIKKSIFDIKFIYFACYAIFSLSNVFFRSLRYRMLIKPLKIKVSSMFGLTLVRNLFVDMFPAKIGSLSYVALLNQRYRISMDICFASFFYAVLFDVLSLPPYLLLSAFGVTGVSHQIPWQYLLIGGLLMILIVACIIGCLDKIIHYAVMFIRKCTASLKFQKNKYFMIAIGKLDEVEMAVVKVKQLKIMRNLFGISLLIRLFKYSALYCLFAAVSKDIAGIFSVKKFSQMIFGITSADFTAILPVQGLAGFGTWETGWSFAFMMFGMPKSNAATIGFLVHLYSQMWEYGIGFLAFCIIVLPYIIKRK